MITVTVLQKLKNLHLKYTLRKIWKKNDVRAEIFMEKYKPKTDRDKISCA